MLQHHDRAPVGCEPNPPIMPAPHADPSAGSGPGRDGGTADGPRAGTLAASSRRASRPACDPASSSPRPTRSRACSATAGWARCWEPSTAAAGQAGRVKVLHSERDGRDDRWRASGARPRSGRASGTRTSSRCWTSTSLPDGTPYLVLEYLEGEIARAAPRARAAAARAGDRRSSRQVGSALAAAHREGIVHRDLKPREHLPRADRIGRRGARRRQGARLRHLEDPRLARR